MGFRPRSIPKSIGFASSYQSQRFLDKRSGARSRPARRFTGRFESRILVQLAAQPPRVWNREGERGSVS
jgi:hypothetical protein